MSEVLFQIGVAKLALSLGLGAAALAVQRRFDRPQVSHALWALVLLALLVPSLIPVPIPVLGSQAPAGGVVAGGTVGSAGVTGAVGPGGLIAAVPGAVKAGFVAAWLIGSVCLVLWSLVRTVRFRRLLAAASTPASPWMQRLAGRMADSLGLDELPEIRTTRANLSPMVWWIGGRVRVLIPAGLAASLDASDLRWIVAHELAHVKRRDHVTRWIEWLACVAFWWNPVAWWTRRELRSAEEFCCDGLVLSTVGGSPREYGSSLISVIDHLSSPPVTHPPAFASALDSGGRTYLIERRLRKIMTRTPVPNTPPLLRATLAIGGLAALCLGLINCGADADALGPEMDEITQSSMQKADLVELRNAFLHEDFDHSEQAGERACADCHVGPDAVMKAEKIRANVVEIREQRATATWTEDELELVDRKARTAEGRASPERAAGGVLRAFTEEMRAAIVSGELSKEEAALHLKRQTAGGNVELRAAESAGGAIADRTKNRIQSKERPSGN